MNNLLQRGIQDHIIVIDERRDLVTYLPQGKQRKLSNPEEAVQIASYLSLVYDYGYPVERVIVSDPVKMGSAKKEADIVVYDDDALTSPHIIVECKKQGISEAAFDEAIEQGISYAAPTRADFVWATSGDRNAYFRVNHERIYERNPMQNIPPFGGTPVGQVISQTAAATFNTAGDVAVAAAGVPISAASKLFRSETFIETIIFTAVYALFVLVMSKLAVEFSQEVFAVLRPFWKRHGVDLQWVYNGIVGVGALLSASFGSIFLRRHTLFQAAAGKRSLIVFFVWLVLFFPAWYVGTIVPRILHKPEWWSLEHYENARVASIEVYLVAFAVALPAQIIVLMLITKILRWNNRR